MSDQQIIDNHETQLAKHGDRLPDGNHNPMSMIELAIERGAEPAQLEKLMDLQERWEQRQASIHFAEQLAAFQAKCPPIMKRRNVSLGGGGYTYASLDDIMCVIKPILHELGLSVTFSCEVGESGQLRATCRVRSGVHTETTDVCLPVPSQMKVNDTQKMGAAISYAKRYALCAALNIVVTDEDSDASRMGEKISDNQVIQVEEMLSTLDETSQQRFYEWLGVKSAAEIPKSRFGDVLHKLRSKLKKMGNLNEGE